MSAPVRMIPTEIEGVVLIERAQHRDGRGWLTELWNSEQFAAAGLEFGAAQDSLSFSHQGVVRGLHFQNPNPQGKLLICLQGRSHHIAVDLRRSSRTFGRFLAQELNAETSRALWIGRGFAHGFAAVTDTLTFYKCDAHHRPSAEWTLAWDDPDLGIQWPVDSPRLSPRDQEGHCLAQLPPQAFFP